MARPTNYKFERMERSRTKAQKKEARREAKAKRREAAKQGIAPNDDAASAGRTEPAAPDTPSNA